MHIERERKYFHTRWVWLFPIAFAFHVLEESRGFADWVTGTLHGQIDVQTFYWNNAGFMAILLLLTALTHYKKSRLAVALLFFWVSGQQFWNCVFHVYTQWRFNAYSPGYFTAIFLYLPVFQYLSYLALREGFIRPAIWGAAILVGAFGMWFTIWAGLYHFAPFPWHAWL